MLPPASTKYTGEVVSEYGIIFEDQLSTMVFIYISLGFIVAYAMASIWMTAAQQRTDAFDALQAA